MKKLKCLPYNYSFNEELLAKALFELNRKEVAAFVRARIEKDNTLNKVLELVVRYLLFIEKLTPVEVRELIVKYAVVICHMYINAKPALKNEGLKSEILDKMLVEGLTVEALRNTIVNDNDIFADLFNRESYIKYNYAIKRLRTKLDDLDAKKMAEKVNNVLRADFDYFSRSTNLVVFNNCKSMKRFDMLIAEALLESDFFKFEFEITDIQELIDNLDESSNDRDIRNAYIYLGFLTHYAVIDRFDPNSVEPPILKPACMDKDVSKAGLGIVLDDILNLKRDITVKYNNELYLIKQNTIEKLC